LSFPIVVDPPNPSLWRHALGRTNRRAASCHPARHRAGDLAPARDPLALPSRPAAPGHPGRLRHLHQFTIGGLRYGDPEQVGEPEFEDDARSFDETAVRLRDFGRVPDPSFLYLYDFGDHWQHNITFERLIAIDPAPRTASCIAGARVRPPEDVGGTPGYANFLEIITDPGHPEHRETLTWCGGRFDPEAFNLDRTNRDVTAALRANRRIRRRQ